MKTILLDYVEIASGQTTDLDLTGFSHIVSAEVRWRGKYSTRLVDYYQYNYESGVTSASYPFPPGGYQFDNHSASGSCSLTSLENHPVTVYVTVFTPDGEWTQAVKLDNYGDKDTVYLSHSCRSPIYGDTCGFVIDKVGQNVSDWTGVTCFTHGRRSEVVIQTDTRTVNPAIKVNGELANYSGILDDGEESTWVVLNGLAPAVLNTLSHAIENSRVGYYQVKLKVEPRLPAPTRHGPEQGARQTERHPWFEFTLPQVADNSAQHYQARVRISRYATMSPLVYTFAPRQSGEWQYWNGAWNDWPQEGVPPGSKVRVRPTVELGYQTYYWDCVGHDGYNYGYISTAWRLKVLVSLAQAYYLEIEGNEWLALSVEVVETANGEVGEIKFVLSNLPQAGQRANEIIKYGDRVVLAISDRLGNAEMFTGVVRLKEPHGEKLHVTAPLGDTILTDRIVKQDYPSQDIGITLRHIVENYCAPLTCENIPNTLGFITPVAAKDQRPIQVFEELRHQFGLHYFVDKDWDTHVYQADDVQKANVSIAYKKAGER